MSRFSLRSMFIGVTALCLALVAANWTAWYRSTKSLAACIADVNAAAQRDSLGKTYAPLTEDYVYSWLQANIDKTDQPAELKAELRRVVRTGRLPRSADLQGAIGHSVTRGWFTSTPRKDWNYTLSFEAGESRLWGVEIPAQEFPRDGVNWGALAYSLYAPVCSWLAVVM